MAKHKGKSTTTIFPRKDSVKQESTPPAPVQGDTASMPLEDVPPDSHHDTLRLIFTQQFRKTS